MKAVIPIPGWHETVRCRFRVALVELLILVLTAGCRDSDRSGNGRGGLVEAPWLEEVAAESGFRFLHDAGPTGAFFMPQSIGSGAAFFDFDQDGFLDLYLIQNAGAGSTSVNRLFRQEPDGRWIDVSAESGLDVAGRGMGVAVGDVNNDGWPDVVVTEYRAVRLFLNLRGQRFREVSLTAGLDNPSWAVSAAFLDYDRDGWLDLVVANYVDYNPTQACWGKDGRAEFCGPGGFPSSVSRLFRNLGTGEAAEEDGVRFEDVTISSGLARAPGPALGVVCADFNGDRWPDILFTDDAKPNRLWISKGDGTFVEEAARRGIAFDLMGQARANMGIAFGDADGDGLADVFVTHLTEESHTLWAQGPPGLFRDRTTEFGLARSGWRGTGFGTAFADFDHDGNLDLAIVNGGIRREDSPSGGVVADSGSDPFWQAYAQSNQIFRNEGHGMFRDRSGLERSFCEPKTVSRGLARADFDNDGDVDLLVTDIGAPARLYRNVGPKAGSWLTVRAVDPSLGGRDAYGAEIRVHAGPRHFTAWLNPASSFLSSDDPRVHFGLGQAGKVDTMEVVWPDGTVEGFAGGPANRLIVLRKGEGKGGESDGEVRRVPDGVAIEPVLQP